VTSLDDSPSRDKNSKNKNFPPKLMRKKTIDQNMDESKSNRIFFESNSENNESNQKYRTLSNRLIHSLGQSNMANFLSYEFFYPNIDYGYFSKNEFVECLNDYNLKNVDKLTKYEWNIIRNLLGKPRRFSDSFLKFERENLKKYRELVRNSYVNDQNDNELLDYEIPKIINDHQKVKLNYK
jgi:hypothetical protein